MVQSLPTELGVDVARALQSPDGAIVLCRIDGSHGVVHLNPAALDVISSLSSRVVQARSLEAAGPEVSLPSLLPQSLSAEVASAMALVRQTGQRLDAIAPVRDSEGNVTGYLLYVLSPVRGYLACSLRTVSAGLGESHPPEVAISPAALRAALRNGELILYAQPVIDVVTGHTSGAEMLVRWRHPTRGLLNPLSFLATAEGHDLLEEFGAWVIDRCVMQAAEWERNSESMDYFRVGINLSPRQLTHSDVVGDLRSAMARHGTTPDNFLVEVVESPVLDSRSAAAAQLRDLLDLGVRVGIDDFGAGLANMAYLRDLPVDVIKVDRSLMGLEPTARDERIMSAVQTIAEAVGADVVLEGVERAAQFDVARRCGIRFAQGFLIGRPTLPESLPPRGLMPLGPAADLHGHARTP